MTFKIKFEPLNPIAGVKPATREYATASEAWIQAQGLMASDEQVTIYGPGGGEIGWQELKILAEREAQ